MTTPTIDDNDVIHIPWERRVVHCIDSLYDKMQLPTPSYEEGAPSNRQKVQAFDNLVQPLYENNTEAYVDEFPSFGRRFIVNYIDPVSEAIMKPFGIMADFFEPRVPEIK